MSDERSRFHARGWISQGAGADLYHDHPKCKDIRLSRVLITTIENFWCGPPWAISLHFGHENGTYTADNRGKPKICQSSTTVVVNENVGLIKVVNSVRNHRGEVLAPFKSPCVVWLAWRNVRPSATSSSSRNTSISQGTIPTNEVLTRRIRSAPGFLPRYSVSVPFGIHSDTNCKGSWVTPMKGTMFGCLNLFHMIASL